jgi:hypothetical protein
MAWLKGVWTEDGGKKEWKINLDQSEAPLFSCWERCDGASTCWCCSSLSPSIRLPRGHSNSLNAPCTSLHHQHSNPCLEFFLTWQLRQHVFLLWAGHGVRCRILMQCSAPAGIYRWGAYLISTGPLAPSQLCSAMVSIYYICRGNSTPLAILFFHHYPHLHMSMH